MGIVIEQLRKELKKYADPKVKASSERFFKESLKIHGLKSAVTNSIGRDYFKMLGKPTKAEVFALCDELWQSQYLEETLIACDWSYRMRKQFAKSDMLVFERWIGTYINNWASCDTFCNHTVGELVMLYPDLLPVLKKWTRSPNRWLRRAAAVSLIVPARKGLFLNDIFEIADTLLLDQDDMVQKGYGWMLKVASQPHCEAVFAYVMRYQTSMPRTAFRYAIEKMPIELKKRAMGK